MSFTEIKERFNPDAKFKHSQFVDYANLLADNSQKSKKVDSKIEMNEAMLQFLERQTERQNTAKKEVPRFFSQTEIFEWARIMDKLTAAQDEK